MKSTAIIQGVDFRSDAPVEAVLVERRRAPHGHFKLIHRETAYKADVYLAADDPPHRWALERRVQVMVDDGRCGWRRRS